MKLPIEYQPPDKPNPWPLLWLVALGLGLIIATLVVIGFRGMA